MTRLIHVLPFGMILVLLASTISPGLLAAPTPFDRDELVLESSSVPICSSDSASLRAMVGARDGPKARVHDDLSSHSSAAGINVDGSRSARLFISLEQDLSRRNEASNDLTRADIHQGNHLHRNLPQPHVGCCTYFGLDACLTHGFFSFTSYPVQKRPQILPRPDPDPMVCPLFRILSSLSSRTECPRYRHWRRQSKKWSISFQKGCMLYQRIRRHRFYSLNSTRSTRRTQSPLWR
ncbi:hypothetical protein FB446DRAFT_730708 [Lentinula raphanica]|nr:hypothetical protein FB446DRAFT_730708 [Lentinula raphanica]